MFEVVLLTQVSLEPSSADLPRTALSSDIPVASEGQRMAYRCKLRFWCQQSRWSIRPASPAIWPPSTRTSAACSPHNWLTAVRLVWAIAAGLTLLGCHPTVANAQTEEMKSVLFRDRQQREVRTAVERYREANQLTEQLQGLQWLFDRPQDSFEVGQRGREFFSIKQWAQNHLRDLSPAELKRYREVNEAAARGLWLAASASRDAVMLREVVRRYPGTQGALDAIDAMATEALDRGEVWQAYRLFTETSRDPLYEGKLSPQFLLKSLTAAAITGDSPEVDRLKKLLQSDAAADGFESKLKQLDRLEVSAPALAGNGVYRGYWPAGGDYPASRIVGSPALPRPDWTVNLLAPSQPAEPPIMYELLTSLINKWESEQRDREQPTAVASGPVVIGHVLFVRDYQGLCAVDLRTGKPVWRYTLPGGYISKLQAAAAQLGARAKDVRYADTGLGFADQVASQGVTGMLSTDGKLLYCVADADGPVPVSRDADGNEPANTLFAFDVESLSEPNREGVRSPAGQTAAAKGAPSLLWKIGGLRDAADPHPLNGCYFLGPPVRYGSQLLVIAEIEREVSLVSLDPATGAMRWQQPLAICDRLDAEDFRRRRFGCRPTIAAGVALCSTHAGVLVAYDLVSDTLLWATPDRDAAPKGGIQRDNANQDDSLRGLRRTHLGFDDSPLVDGDRCLYLPAGSNYLHLLDIKTGRKIWTVTREDAEYLGAIHAGVVLVVGRQHCRGFSIKDGKQIWKTPTGLPAGLGVGIGTHFLLPLDTARMRCIEIATGKDLSLPVSGGDTRLGNLLVVGDQVVSAGARVVAGFPQARPLMLRLAAKKEDAAQAVEGAAQSMQAQQQILQAELQMVLGDLTGAITTLEELLQSNTTSKLPAERLLRDALHERLKESPDNPGQTLIRLKQLSRNEEEAARDLAWISQWQLRGGDVEGLLTSLRELRSLRQPILLDVPQDPGWKVSPAAWQQLLRATSLPELSDSVWEAYRQELLSLATAPSHASADLEQFLSTFPDDPFAPSCRLELGKLYAGQGQLQAAEFQLLAAAAISKSNPQRVTPSRSAKPADDSASPESVLRNAEDELCQLWDDAQFPVDAVRMLLPRRNSDSAKRGVPLNRQVSPGLQNAWIDLQPPLAPVSEVRITGRVGENIGIASDPWEALRGLSASEDATGIGHYGQFRRRFFAPNEFAADLLVKGTEQETGIVAIDRWTGVLRGSVPIPAQYSSPAPQSSSFVGHYFPVGVAGGAVGVSLLEMGAERSLWNRSLVDQPGQSSLTFAGPAGPGFAVFQNKHRLFVVSPSSGAILWQRSQPESSWGLQVDQGTGIFGDDQVLVVRLADKQGYLVYDTATGRKLREGKLNLDLRSGHRPFGRKLFYVTAPEELENGSNRRFRVWDPLTDKIVFDEPAGERVFFSSIGEHELAILNRFGELKIFDVTAERVQLVHRFGADDLRNLDNGLNYLRTFADAHHYFINLQRNMAVVQTVHYNYAMSDTFIPAIHLRDDVYTFAKKTGELKWTRSVPARSVLQIDSPELPFLVTVSRIRDRNDANLQSLSVEVIDSQTGLVLGQQSQLPADRLLTFSYSARDHRLTLVGMRNLIELKLVLEQAP